jgi:hypothetical protein
MVGVVKIDLFETFPDYGLSVQSFISKIEVISAGKEIERRVVEKVSDELAKAFIEKYGQEIFEKINPGLMTDIVVAALTSKVNAAFGIEKK